MGFLRGLGTSGCVTPARGFLSWERGARPVTQTRQCGPEYDARNGAPLYGLVVSLDNSGSRGDRLPQRTVCSQGRRIRFSSVCTNPPLSLRRGHRAYFDRDSTGFAVFSAIWQYLRWRDAVAHDADDRVGVAVRAGIPYFGAFSASILLSRTVGRPVAGICLRDAVCRLY